MVKVIHLMIGLGTGGVENFVLQLCRQHKANNVGAVVVGITSHQVRKEEFDRAGIENHILHIDSWRSFSAGMKKLQAIQKKNPTAILHAHGFHALMLGCLLQLTGKRLKMVFTIHTNFIRSRLRKLLIYVTRPFRKQDIVFSADSRKWYNKRNSIIIENGIDVPLFQQQKTLPPEFTCLFLGRLEEAKNPLYLVDLMKQLNGKVNFKVRVAGEGQLLNELKEKISENQFEERFELLGFRKDAAELLKSSHCVLVPSLWEGMPLVVLEAGAAETPMLVTPVGSIPSILNTDNAFIGSLSDWPKMLSDLYADYATGQQKAKKLSRLVENRYSIRASAEKHLSLYSAIAASKLN